MSKSILLFCFIVFSALLFLALKPQQIRNVRVENQALRVMFYNVENLFDTKDDSLTNDEEFLPDGQKKWNYFRYSAKINKLYKVIVTLGETEAPDVIGLCEIENAAVLKDLIYQTPLSKFPYAIVHKESPDARGIDVALLYRKDRMTKISQEFISVKMDNNPEWKTRDILAFRASGKKGGELYFFVNHWPSRSGGEKKSESKRLLAAHTLRNYIETIQQTNSCTNIIVMGDFNDTPYNHSIATELLSNHSDKVCNKLINLSLALADTCKCGSYKYRNEWNMIDQFIVSQSLKDGRNGFILNQGALLFNPDFLLEQDKKYGGYKPLRTYLGPQYLGGYSDHLPIYLDLFDVN